MRAVICYHTFSGNTQEVAEYLEEHLVDEGYEVDTYRVGVGLLPDLEKYDTIFIGTFTWERGSTPEEIKDFILDVGYKPSNVFIFGTGDTQFGGDDLFCLATDKLHKFYNAKHTPLKIEQSPRGSQERIIKEWIGEVIRIDKRTIKKG